MANLLPTYFISHGGGPWPFVPEMKLIHAQLEASLLEIRKAQTSQLKAILMVSGHWEEAGFTVQGGQHPPMLYDYYGFPRHTYQVQYKAPGYPEIARRVQELLLHAGIHTAIDEKRGFDHGTFVPLFVMYPEAEIPVIQLSLKASYDPKEHLAAGRALLPLRDEGVLIIGSGLSYHNLRLFGPGAREPSALFDRWLNETLALADRVERSARLSSWEKAPAARIAHPQEDHLLPLMVALGAAEEESATCIYHEETLFGGVVASSFGFGI